MEEEVFKKSKVNYNKLLDYGFIKDNNNYIYSINFMNNTFKAIITINNDIINGKVIDLNTNEEYLALRVKSNNGSYVNEVRNNYINILNDIKDNCFDYYIYISKQANDIIKYVNNKYNDSLEFLWDKYPPFGILRNKHNNKWYALLGSIYGSTLNIDKEEIEIINLKLDKDLIKELLIKDGYYEAYHMNKKYWITIVLDNSVNISDIYKYIDYSYNIIDKGE